MAPHWARVLCDRHFGVGADGLIVLFDLSEKKFKLPEFVKRYPNSEPSPYAWTYTNSDGSWSHTCGNGLRSAALFLQEQTLVNNPRFSIATAVGSLAVEFVHAKSIVIDLGLPVLSGLDIPTSWDSPKCVGQSILISCFDQSYELAVTAVGMGNPHCVIFDPVRGDGKAIIEREDRGSLEKVARFIQQSAFFPESVNVEFAFALKRDKVILQVFERGCGWTLACGTGRGNTFGWSARG